MTGMSFDETMQILQDFLEVIIHNILYLRAVYPADLFEKFKKYDVPVYKSRHPQLCLYIAEVVKSAMTNIVKGIVKKVVVAVKDASTDRVLEHFVLSLLWIKSPAFFDDANARRQYDSGMSRKDAELMLRSFLTKLSTVEAQLGRLPEDLTFTVFIELFGEGTRPDHDAKSGPIPWLPASLEDERLTEEAYKNARLHALKGTQFGVVDLALQVEESPEKIERMKAAFASQDSDVPPPLLDKNKGKGRATD